MTEEEKRKKTEAAFEAREKAAGLRLAGNDTTKGHKGNEDKTFSQREAEAGVNLAGGDSTSGLGKENKGSVADTDSKKDEANIKSVERQRENRAKRDLIKQRKSDMKVALAAVSGSTRAMREVKRSFKEQGYLTSSTEIGNRRQPGNLQDANSTIQITGIDKVENTVSESDQGY